MPMWFWYAAAGLIAAATLYLLYRHFFMKRGSCCENKPSCSHECASCPHHCENKR
ncbi:MAG: hypothetical protein J5772_02630 [Clostridia bacterium]|nr:hypothetical protein [Clostridia bacterium]